MTTLRITFASVGIAALLLPGAALAGGGSLSRADFERCNQQAMQVAGISDAQSPSASPTTSGSGTSGSGSTSSSGTSTSAPSASGSTTPSASGSTTPSASGSSTSGSSVSGSGTQPSGSTSAAGGADHDKLDKAVQAYRDCLQK